MINTPQERRRRASWLPYLLLALATTTKTTTTTTTAFTSSRQQPPQILKRVASLTLSATNDDNEKAVRVRNADGTFSPRFLADNGLEITRDETGRITARPATKAAAAAATAVVVDPKNSTMMTSSSPAKISFKVNGDTTTTTTNNNNNNNENNTNTNNMNNTKKARKAEQRKRNKEKSLAAASASNHNNNNNNNNNNKAKHKKEPLMEHSVNIAPQQTGFNVVLTHCTADFDSLASAVGLAKLWSQERSSSTDDDDNDDNTTTTTKDFDSSSHVPTFVVLPRGAHPGVQRFLALHKHLFPIRSLKSLPDDLSSLNRLALVDAQRRDRIGPAAVLLEHANRVTVVDHHVAQDSDIPATDYVVDNVGSVSTLIAERLQQAGVSLSEAEATLLALGIHADTGSLCFDSTSPRDAYALAWCLEEGASQAAIAEHAQSSLSVEQQGVLTQALINTNTTVVHGVSVSTVLLTADGFIQGLATVTQDALELSSSDVFLLGLVYEAKSGGSRKGKKKKSNEDKHQQNAEILTSRLLLSSSSSETGSDALRKAFERVDIDKSGCICEREVSQAMSSMGIVLSDPSSVKEMMAVVDQDGDGRIDFDEFVQFASKLVAEQEKKQKQEDNDNKRKSSTTLIVIGRVKAGVNTKAIKLNKLLEPFGGGGHPKAASATMRMEDEAEAKDILQNLVDDLIETSLQAQPTVGDFMTAPVLSVKPTMNEKQVEDLFTRYDVRALPVVDDDNDVVGLVTYQLVAAAKQRLWNKEQKRLRRERDAAAKGLEIPQADEKVIAQRKNGAAVKGWMLQHVQTVEASMTMAQVETILLENDVGCLPVVADGTKQLVGMVTRTDLLRQHRYYDSLPYHNKGFAQSIAARKPIIELRRRLKQFDLD